VTQPTTSPQPAAPEDVVPETNEITVGGATALGTAQLPRVETTDDEVQPTGPVDFVPGLPGAGTPPPPAADTPETPETARTPRTPRKPRTPRTSKAPRTPRTPEQRATGISAGLGGLGVALLQMGLLGGFGAVAYWSTVTLWSAFATVAALIVLLPTAARRLGLRPDAAWKVAAGGLTGTAVFWVLVVLPQVDSDRGFVLTAALAALGAALWVAPARRA
jgi:hypothetical protein